MQIHWYPGHMHKAQRKIREIMPQVDVMIELVDARLPESSSNSLLSELRGEKPVLRIMNKADLADPKATKAWQAEFRKRGELAYATHMNQKQRLQEIPQLCRELAPRRGIPGKPVRALIAGIPNVGKSSLINALAGKKVARTGNEPAVTQRQQKISAGKHFQLLDTPGIMQPSPESEMAGYRLAASGAIRATAMEYEDVALFLTDYLLQAYPGVLGKRYKAQESGAPETLSAIAVARGCFREQDEPDLHRASEILLNEFRTGKLGRISLEFPDREVDYRLI